MWSQIVRMVSKKYESNLWTEGNEEPTNDDRERDADSLTERENEKKVKTSKMSSNHQRLKMERFSKSSECSDGKMMVCCYCFFSALCLQCRKRREIFINKWAYLLCATQSVGKCVLDGITWNYFQFDPFSYSSALSNFIFFIHFTLFLCSLRTVGRENK